VTSDSAATDAAAPAGQTPAPSRRRSVLWYLIPLVILVDVIALIVSPPQNVASPEEACAFPACFVESTLHLPAPHVLVTADGAPVDTNMITAQLSITDSLLTMVVITIIVLVGLILLGLRPREVPGGRQNFIEWAIESLEGFAKGMGGAAAARYVPLFAAFFILILMFNWSGLLPIVGRIEGLRAPTSDVNVTIGLALVAFFTFHIEGFRRLGFKGYAGKFFPLYEFKQGIGAGLIALFVGLVELMLEFVKPLTLSMRLFGNIYGGEVALGVVTAITVAVIPVALYGLEVMLNFVQALIFSTLALMFTIAAIESHHHEEGELGHEGMEAMHDATHPLPAAAH
jgi:F-type H+-transporting ATPase subunit a